MSDNRVHHLSDSPLSYAYLRLVFARSLPEDFPKGEQRVAHLKDWLFALESRAMSRHSYLWETERNRCVTSSPVDGQTLFEELGRIVREEPRPECKVDDGADR